VFWYGWKQVANIVDDWFLIKQKPEEDVPEILTVEHHRFLVRTEIGTLSPTPPGFLSS
jgi:hypothetical protein